MALKITQIHSNLYAHNVLRPYGRGEEYSKKEKEKPSAHKMSLLSNLPVELVGPYPASIFVNDNCDIIFKTKKGTCYYVEVSNELIEQFNKS